MGNPGATLSAADAIHLLRRAGFGAAPKDVVGILNKYPTRGQAVAWLLSFKVSRFKPIGRETDDRRNSWLNLMITTPNPLREKLVLFWHDHFSTSDDKVDNPVLMGNQNQLLRIFCRGNFKDFVKAINKDAAMLYFLDTVDNVKDQPNENYGRELQELFTLGVSDYNGHRNYEQADVTQIARAFSGWNFNNRGVAEFGAGDHDYTADYPDRGPKVIYKTAGKFTPNYSPTPPYPNPAVGVDYTLPPYNSVGEGATEIDSVIEIIFSHKDSDGQSTVARFIVGKLFAFFAQPYPKRPALMSASQLSTLKPIVDELISDSGFDQTWDIGALLNAIFVNDAFYDPTLGATNNQAPFSPGDSKSVKWPVDFAISTLRVLSMRLRGRSAYINGGNFDNLSDLLENMGQILFEPPSVFGWNWETAWINSATLLARYQLVVDVISAHTGGATSFQPKKLIPDILSLTDPTAIVKAVTDALGLSNPSTSQLTSADQAALVNYLTDGGTVTSLDFTDSDTRNRKLNGLIGLILESPAYQLY